MGAIGGALPSTLLLNSRAHSRDVQPLGPGYQEVPTRSARTWLARHRCTQVWRTGAAVVHRGARRCPRRCRAARPLLGGQAHDGGGAHPSPGDRASTEAAPGSGGGGVGRARSISKPRASRRGYSWSGVPAHSLTAPASPRPQAGGTRVPGPAPRMPYRSPVAHDRDLTVMGIRWNSFAGARHSSRER